MSGDQVDGYAGSSHIFHALKLRLYPTDEEKMTEVLNRKVVSPFSSRLRDDSMHMSLGELQELVMDREAWRAAIHEVTKSQTWLSDWTELRDGCEGD